MNKIPWSISSLWNECLVSKPRRKDEPRDYLYASELGSSMRDIYLKMINIPQTNPPNFRSLRKFEAGNIVEWILRFVLIRAGILQSTQDRIKYGLPGCLEVSGKLDFIAGGTMDFSKIEKELAQLELPDIMDYASRKIIDHFKKQFKDTNLERYILECKSCSERIFDRNEAAGQPNQNHKLQAFHYLYGSNEIDGAKVAYICKDDLRIKEYVVNNDEVTFNEYKSFIEKMTDFYTLKELPPLEKCINFDEVACRFSKNWKVEYSPYLTHSYGFETPDDFRNQWQYLSESINRVYQRCVTGKTMTVKNKEVIEKAKKEFPNWDDLVDIGKLKGILEEPEED